MGEVIDLKTRRVLGANGQPIKQKPVSSEEILAHKLKEKDVAMETLQHKCDISSQPRKISFEPHVEDRFRDVEAGQRSVNTILDSFNMFLGYMEQRVVDTSTVTQRLSMDIMNTRLYIQALQDVLIESGVLTEEKLQKSIENVMEAQMKRMEEAKKKMEADSKRMKEELAEAATDPPPAE